MSRAAITVLRPPEEVERLWRESAFRVEAETTFQPAPGDRGTEIHVTVGSGGPLQKIFGSDPLPKVKDQLRRFKQTVETGEISRSDGTPAGESVESKLNQRPAQPLSDEELREVLS
jgi:hypothetical protein